MHTAVSLIVRRPCRSTIATTALILAVALAPVACGGGGDSPSPTAATSVLRVTVAPATLTVIQGQQAQLTATAFDAAGVALTGRAATWISTAPQVATVDASGTVSGVAAGTATIRATISGRSSQAAVQVAPLLRGDVAVADAQWTQGAQRDGNGGAIPMVEDRAAMLSVLLRATVEGSAPGQLLLRLTDAAGLLLRTDTVVPRPITTADFAAPSAQFLVPAALVRAGVRWEVVRDPRLVAVDDSAATDRFPRTGPAALRTVATLPLRIRVIPIVLGAHDNVTAQVTPADLPIVFSAVRSLYPHARIESTIGTPVTISASFGVAPTGGNGPTFWNQAMRQLDVARLADPSAGDSYWFGFVRVPPGFTNLLSGGGGFVPANPRTSGPLTRTALALELAHYLGRTNGEETHADLVAHELTHTLGRNHAPACGAGEVIDRSYPTVDGTIGVVGFGLAGWAAGSATRPVLFASTTPDVMSYCRPPTWVSPYTYEALLNIARTTVAATTASLGSAADGTAAASSRTHALVVEGEVGRDGRVRLGPVFPITLRLGDDTGPLLVEALDDAGRVLASRRTTPGAGEHDADGARAFLATLPITPGDEARVAEVRVNGTGIAAPFRRASARTSPAGAPANDGAIARREGTQLQCTRPGTVALLATDATTGAILGRADGTTMRVPITVVGSAIRVACSDGVASQTMVLR